MSGVPAPSLVRLQGEADEGKRPAATWLLAVAGLVGYLLAAWWADRLSLTSTSLIWFPPAAVAIFLTYLRPRLAAVVFVGECISTPVIMGATASYGVAGVIVDGACRDLDEARQLGFPVFAAAAVPTTARNRAVERAWGEPITLGRALRVRRGDLVVADASGVAFIGAERAAEVIDAAEDIFGREAAMAAALRAGGRASEVMGRSYEELVHDRKGAQPWR